MPYLHEQQRRAVWAKRRRDANEPIGRAVAQKYGWKDKKAAFWYTTGPGNLGIPRDEMPQIPQSTGQDVKFREYLKRRGVKIRSEHARVGDLKATQKEVDLDKVSFMMRQLRQDAEFQEKAKQPLLVSKDHHILDGHHRWMAQREADKDQKIAVDRVEIPMQQLLAHARAFPSSHHGEGSGKDKHASARLRQYYVVRMEKQAELEKEAIFETLRVGYKALKQALHGGTALAAPAGVLQPEREAAVKSGQELMEKLKGHGLEVHRARVKSPGSIEANGQPGVPNDLLGLQAYARSPEEVAKHMQALHAAGVNVKKSKLIQRPGYHGINVHGEFNGTPLEMQFSPGRRSNAGQIMEHSLAYKPETEAPRSNFIDRWVGKHVAPKLVGAHKPFGDLSASIGAPPPILQPA